MQVTIIMSGEKCQVDISDGLPQIREQPFNTGRGGGELVHDVEKKTQLPLMTMKKT